MRLRLFERLRRIASRRSQDPGRGRTPDLRFREDSGRHRKNPAVAPSPGQRTAQPRMAGDGPRQPPAGLQPPAGMQPPAGLPARPGQPLGSPRPPAGLVSPPADPWLVGPAAPPAPGTYMPRTVTDGPARGGVAPVGGGSPAGGRRTGGGAPAAGGVGRARIREAPFGAAPVEQVAIGPEAHWQAPPAMPREPWYQVVSGPAVAQQHAQSAGFADAALAQSAPPAAPATHPGTATPSGGMRAARGMRRAALPFAGPHPKDHPPTADGRRNCGAIEAILWRQWDADAAAPPPEVIAAVDRLAEFPRALQEKLAAGLDGIYVGAGGVPDLDDMAALHGVALPSGRATWDACAGAYGERKIVVGSRPSPTPDVMCHEIGHALDDLDSPPGRWQSDSAEFRLIYDQCQPFIASDFHRQRGGLGRKEFFADAFAAIASAQRPALVDMLSGNTRIALRVMLYFNRRYGI
jgi:hypothetical protein